MRIPDEAHTAQPWRIHELTPDFALEDVWALPADGGREEFPLLVEGICAGDPSHSSSGAARALWWLRWQLGERLGWDGAEEGLGSRVPTLQERLPADLRAMPGPDFAALPFRSLYLTEDEFAAEVANRTAHGVMHLGWVEQESGKHRGQLAVLVKPNGALGAGYMAAIKPFRHRVVYPSMLKQIDRAWRARSAGGGAAQ
ncbi:MAG TPA: DUF2867 domain-containing protein [Solirubrobacterales bacterium]|jgi:hypothetical protein